MITTLLTATVLVAALTGAPQLSVTHHCRKGADGWMRLFFDADLPGGALSEERGTHAVSTACHTRETVPAEESRPAESPRGSAAAGDSPDGGAHPANATGLTTRGLSKPGLPKPDLPEPGLSGRGRRERESSGSPRFSAPSLPVRPPVAVPTPGTGEIGEIGETDEIGESHEGGKGDGARGVSRGARHDRLSGRVALSPRRPSRAPSPGWTAVTTALRQVGRPYVWGGGSSTGPTGGGFDCSGLALHAWSKAGARLAHYTGSQFRQGRRVPFSRLRPGDLLFFGGGAGDPTHVGVYVGNGVMVHAPKPGDVVRTTNFAISPYYRARYRGAVRPHPGGPVS